MVIKGRSVGGARRLAVHLLRTDTNERAEVAELRGVVAENLRGALLEVEAVASGTRTKKPFYHASINTRADEPLTDAQRAHAIDRLEATLGLTGQARVVVIHKKEGREHCHIVWSRIDLDHMRAISDSHNYRKHEQVARDLEREFGHERVQGAHIEREGRPRPKRTPSHAEMLQGDRTGLTAKEVAQQLTDMWRRIDNGPAFVAALGEAGYVLARGDRRDFVVIDRVGGTHSLSRRIEGATAQDIRTRLTGIDAQLLPNVVEAKRIQRERDSMDTRSFGRDQQAAVVREDEEARSRRAFGASLEWTDRGGMVEQQQAAMDWFKAAQEHKKASSEQTERRQVTSAADQARTAEQQALARQFGRDIEEGLRDELEQDGGRERTRG